MARKVFISSDISFDENLDRVAQENPTAALMWPWLLTYFDDWGRASASPSRIRRQVFSAFAFSDDEIRAALQLYAQVGLLLLYQGPDGRDYIAIPKDKWFAYQTHIRAEKRDRDRSKYPAPPTSAMAGPTSRAGSREDARDDAHLRVPERDDAQLRASPSPSPSPAPSPSPSPSPSEDPPLPFANANGLTPADAAGAAPHRPTDAAAPAPQPRQAPRRLDPAIRALVKTWRDELTAQGIPLPRDWHLVAGGILTRSIQAGRDVTSLADWWTWARDHPYWVRRRHEPDLWWRSFGEWRASQGAPLPRDRPNGRPRHDWLAGGAAVEALLHADRGPPPTATPPTDEEGRTDDPP